MSSFFWRLSVKSRISTKQVEAKLRYFSGGKNARRPMFGSISLQIVNVLQPRVNIGDGRLYSCDVSETLDVDEPASQLLHQLFLEVGLSWPLSCSSELAYRAFLKHLLAEAIVGDAVLQPLVDLLQEVGVECEQWVDLQAAF